MDLDPDPELDPDLFFDGFQDGNEKKLKYFFWGITVNSVADPNPNPDPHFFGLLDPDPSIIKQK
jgi:hypothetical protein